MHRVSQIEYLDYYRIKLDFKNGKVKIIDLEDELRGAKNKFRDLQDLSYFKKVKCDGFSIIWPNDIDFCPDWLYKNAKDVPSTKRSPVKRASAKPKRKVRTVK